LVLQPNERLKVVLTSVLLHCLFWLVQAYYIIDELFINGELQESSKKEVLSVCAQMDEMMDDTKDDNPNTAKGGGKR